MASEKRLVFNPVLTTESLAGNYLQLARLEEAGFPALQAFELIKGTNRIRVQQLQMHLKAGNSITVSGVKSGFFNPADKEVLNAGEVCGRLGYIYQQLASHYAEKARRVRKIKSQSYLPTVVLILFLFIRPLPELIAHEITGLDYLKASMGELFKVAMLVTLMVKLPFWLTQGRLGFLGLGPMIYYLQVKLPVISTWLISRQINEFLRSLGLMLDAGVSAADALPKAIRNIRNPILRTQFNPLQSTTFKGCTLAELMAKVSVIDRQFIQVIETGEKSGKLAQTLLHFSKIDAEKINLQEDLLAEWIPRIFYFFVLGLLAVAIMGNKTPVS